MFIKATYRAGAIVRYKLVDGETTANVDDLAHSHFRFLRIRAVQVLTFVP